MIVVNKIPKERILIVDAIRGFALFGILMIHSVIHFDLIRYPGPGHDIFTQIDPLVHSIISLAFKGKAYAMFSFMFGFSFFILMQNRAEQGIDFRARFLWRLLILGVFGYFHSLLYVGDFLMVFAVLGIPLIFLYKVHTKILIVIAALLFLQMPTLYNLFHSILNPDFIFKQYWAFGEGAIDIYANGSLLDVLKFNAFSGQIAKTMFVFHSGRYLDMLGLFICGLIIGRIKYFENVELKKSFTKKVLLFSSVSALIFYSLRVVVTRLDLNETQLLLSKAITISYAELSLTFVLLSGFVLVYQFLSKRFNFALLAAYGRMSLTSYVSQTLFGVVFYYGFALGMYKFFGITYSLVFAIVVFIIQIYFSKKWMDNFRFGPLEWLWRALTFMDFKIKFKRTEKT